MELRGGDETSTLIPGPDRHQPSSSARTRQRSTFGQVADGAVAVIDRHPRHPVAADGTEFGLKRTGFGFHADSATFPPASASTVNSWRYRAPDPRACLFGRIARPRR